MVEKKKRPAGSSFWQIIFPTLVGAIGVILIGIWFTLYSSSWNLSRFAEISTVLLVIPVFFAGLVFALILGVSILLVSRVMTWIPSVTVRLLEILEKIRQAAEVVTRTAARLVIEPAALLAGLRREKPSESQTIKLDE